MGVTLAVAAKPKSVAPLVAKGGRILAGGTLVVGDLNYGRLASATLIPLDNLGLARISIAGTKVRLGAMVTMAAIGREPQLAFLHPVAKAIGGPSIRSMATIGGNLFAPPPYGDMATALLALDATVTLVDEASQSLVPLGEFLAGRRTQLVTEISFQHPGDNFRFRKAVRRKPVSAAVLSIAAHLPMKRGKVTGARIAFGGMAPTAIRARAVETALEGHRLDAETIAKAVALCGEDIAPADDAYASAWYRREVLPVHLARLLSGNAS